jgi:hypothetical protein
MRRDLDSRACPTMARCSAVLGLQIEVRRC